MWTRLSSECRLVRERMGELADKMDEMGVASEEMVDTYLFSMSQLNWINIDRFYKLPPTATRSILVHHDEVDNARVLLVFTQIKSVLPMYRAENALSYKRDRIPKTEKVAVLAYKVENGQTMVYYEEVDPKNKSFKIAYEPYSFKELRQLLDQVQG